MADVREYDKGDIVEWQGVPVLLLDRPRLKKAHWYGLKHWHAPAMYIRSWRSATVETWKLMDTFQVTNTSGDESSAKERWRGELTDDEYTKIMIVLLGGEIT